jgi:uncharacterized repeat protein (TIGR03803 family)
MKKMYLVFAWCCAILWVGRATAQERLMFSVAHDAPEGLYYLDKNGGTELHACNFVPADALGSGTEYFLVSKDGEIVGINSEDGLPETNESMGYGTLYRVTAKGVVKVQDFNYAEASNTFLVEGWSDGKLYGVAPTAIGDQTLKGTKFTGVTGTKITKYGFRPGELLAAKNGLIYGTAPIGGTNSQGYIYRFSETGITAVYNFTKATGHYPQGRLMQGIDGYLYGVTKRGGRFDYGAIYKVRTDGTGYTVLHHFDKVNGMYPDRGLVQDESGNMYGMTFSGGATNLGVVYKIRPDGTGFTTLHNFTVNQQYFSGVAQSLLLDSDGFLYGRVPQSQSMIFRIKKDGTGFKVLYDKIVYLSSVQLVSSITPEYKLERPVNGVTGVPTTYRFVADSVPGAVTYKVELSTTSDFSTIIASANSFHRRPEISGLQPSTKYYARVVTSLWSKPGPVTSFTTASGTTAATSIVTTPANGATGVLAPTLKVTVRAVTGATRYTVQLNDRSDFGGTMFTQTSTTDNQRTLTFTGLGYNTKYYARVKTDISNTFGATTSFTTRVEPFSYMTSPIDGVADVDRQFLEVSLLPVTGAKIYTLQVSTSSSFSAGTKTLSAIDENQTRFLLRGLKASTKYYTRARTDISTGYGPVKSFTTRAAVAAMRLVGSNIYGGSHGFGTVFSFSIDSMKYTKHYDNLEMRNSYSDIIHAPGGFYAVQYLDGGTGSIFKYDFKTGYHRSATLSIGHETDLMVASNGMIYATPDYLPYANGAIHKMDPTLDSYSRIHFYKSETGLGSRAPLLDYGDGYLYGTAVRGGNYNKGVIFRMRGNGRNYEVLHHFGASSGATPGAGLIDGQDGYLYGTTNAGPGNFGTIYKVKPDGSELIYLHQFRSFDGAYPNGELCLDNSVLYGTTNSGGASGNGVLYKIKTDGSDFAVLKSYDDPEGANPWASVVTDGKGMLYGFLPYGGSEGYGSIYRVRIDGTGYETLFEMTNETEINNEFGMLPFTAPVLIEDPFAVETPAIAARELQVDVYPNPSTSVFNVDLSHDQGEFAVELTDFTGNVVYRNLVTGDQVTIGESLPRGMYVLKVRNGEVITQKTLIKK